MEADPGVQDGANDTSVRINLDITMIIQYGFRSILYPLHLTGYMGEGEAWSGFGVGIGRGGVIYQSSPLRGRKRDYVLAFEGRFQFGSWTVRDIVT